MNDAYYCPVCDSDDYEVIDFMEDYSDLGGSVKWICICNNCKKRFSITRDYEYVNKIIVQESEEEEE